MTTTKATNPIFYFKYIFFNHSKMHISFRVSYNIFSSPPFGGRNFWQIEGDGASRFTAFFTDMALARTSLTELKVGYVFRLASHSSRL